MSRDATALLTWVVLFWIMTMVHLVVLVVALRIPTLQLRTRLLAFIPPLTPVVAWLGGARVVPVLWALAVSAYFLARGLL